VACLNADLDEAASQTAERPATSTILGTLHYMSPEQARGETVSNATDLFSFGVVLYEKATGQHPFRLANRLSHNAMIQALVSQAPAAPARLNPELPAVLDALILRMLEKDASLRPTAAEVEIALEEFAATRRHTDTANQGLVETGEISPRPTIKTSHRHITVGRDKERAELHEGFETVMAGRGLIMCVAGEPGIGKTTIVEEFLGDLTTDGRSCRIARGRCSERLAGTEAYLPWLEALDTLI